MVYMPIEPNTVKANLEDRNADLSHITAGYIENSPSKAFVRADEAYEGEMASSFFDYSNVTEAGLVDNTLTTYDHKSIKPTVWRGYVNSNFPIFDKKILVDSGAVFEGLVNRNFNPSPVAAVRVFWSLPSLHQLTFDSVEYYVSESNSSHGVCELMQRYCWL